MKRRLRKQCLQQLQRSFGLTEFRPGQEAAISALLAGRDLLCILPTGAGKSLCWQLPAVMGDGLTVVVSPLIALMRDQVRQLNCRGVNACALDSLMLPEEREAAVRSVADGSTKIVFVAPERLETDSFRKLCDARPPAMLVVDEAHCVIQWGNEFRPAYSKIAEFAARFTKRPVVCAMTATADRKMQKEIVKSLGMLRCRQVRMPVIRENIHYHVTTAMYKSSEMLRILSLHPGKTVVFCRTRARTEGLASFFSGAGYEAAFYHAGMDRQERLQVQQRFADGELRVMTATTAFGMGVDIPDIRCVIHDYLPDSVTDFVQQSGRAGRDRLEAHCYLMLTPYDLLTINKPFASIRKRMKGAAGYLQMYRKWLPVRELLQACMTAQCIPAALSYRLSGRSRPCGQCSACLSGALRRRVPPLHQMREWQVRAWLLAWQRDEMAKRQGCLERRIMTDRQLKQCARTLEYPKKNGDAADGIMRLIRCFRQMARLEE